MDNIFSIIIVGVMLLALISIVYVSWRNGISPMPSSAIVQHVVANEVKRIAQRGIIVDAGSGFGTLVMHLAKHCPGWTVIGIENSPVPRWISQLYCRVLLAGKGGEIAHNMTIIKGNLYTYSYTEVDVLVCYLYPGAMKKLSVMANNDLTPGMRIISICFALPGREPERVIACKDIYQTKVYVYVV